MTRKPRTRIKLREIGRKWKDIDKAPDWPRSKKVNEESGVTRLDAKYENE
jgi:hypothetical protein